MFWCYPGQQERVCLRRGGTRESTRRCVRRACGACAAQNWAARGKQPATRSSSSQARGLARGRAPLSPLAFFLDSTELYVYLCTVVHTSVRIPLYSTRPTISLIVQPKKLSTSNKPITHYNDYNVIVDYVEPEHLTVTRSRERQYESTYRYEPQEPNRLTDARARPRQPTVPTQRPSGRLRRTNEPVQYRVPVNNTVSLRRVCTSPPKPAPGKD